MVRKKKDAFAIEKLIGVASPSPPSRAYNLRHVTIIIRKWLPNMVKLSGVLDSAHSREDTNIFVSIDHTS